MSNSKFACVFVPTPIPAEETPAQAAKRVAQDRDNLGAVVAKIGKGVVRWRRKGESDGSGKERCAGQFDSRPVVKAWLDATGKRVNYLFIVLDADAGKGEGFRMIPIDRLIEVGAL